jgi:hypothetical protein
VVLVPILIFVACFGVGIVASARWLPDLGPGPVAGLAFFVVCGLLAGALSLAGLAIYSIVREIHEFGGLTSAGNLTNSPEIVAAGIRNLVLESGTLVGLAGIIYLLAPGADESTTSELQPAVSLAEADG